MKLSILHYRALFGVFLAIATYSFFASVPGVDIGTWHFDKVGHCLIFFIFAGLLFKSGVSSSTGVIIIGLIYGGGIELIQDQLEHRQGSWGDLIADITGLILYFGVHDRLAPIYHKLERDNF